MTARPIYLKPRRCRLAARLLDILAAVFAGMVLGWLAASGF